MAISKVIYDGEVLVDLTEDTVMEDTLAKGVTAHNAAGIAVTGNMTGGGNVLYGTCSTSYSTAAKVVVCDDADGLYAGLAILVTFSNYSTASALTLNVNSLGAKNIYHNGGTAGSSNYFRWGSGAAILFIYDGTYWLPVGYSEDWYGASGTAASTAAKTASISDFVLKKGTRATIKFTYANTNAGPTLNVSSTGAFSIIGNINWSAGDTVSFTFDGSSYIAEGGKSLTAEYDADTETLILV